MNKYTDLNIPGVYINQQKRDPFEIEFSVNAIGEVVVDIDVDSYEGNIMNNKILERDELKKLIDGLTKLYEGTE